MSDNVARWERFLDPEVVKPSLFSATMFITTFEILKNCVIDRIRDFYTNEWTPDGSVVGSEYQVEVLARSKSPLYASLKWLQEHEVIDDTDLQTFEALKGTRNLLAHQLFNVVTGEVDSPHKKQFPVLVSLLRKIETWWVVNVEIPINPSFDEKEVDESEIVPGSILSLQVLIEVASGNTEFIEQWRKARPGGCAEA